MVPEAGRSLKAATVPAAGPVALQNGPYSGSIAKSDIISRLMTIISEEAGLELTDLEPGSHFADLGIDSLLSLTISGRLQEELGLDVPSSIFAYCHTVKELVEHIRGPKPSPPASTVLGVARDAESSEDDKDDKTGCNFDQ